MALITKVMPPFMPTTKLNDSRYCANWSFMLMAVWVVMRHQIAVGIPMGEVFGDHFVTAETEEVRICISLRYVILKRVFILYNC